MVNEELILTTVAEFIENPMSLTLDTSFQEMDMDSTNIVELLIEFEILLNTDILNQELNLDDFSTLQDIHDYLKKLC
ncbi:hypothetical protein QUF84_00855 [Fictibacillus enclensis]|uniref:hypothetical protein n=1 Tax=Fictibacillus enclensis TaxID=1017270 RepID=UPI0025A12BA2|nr:hypothetical protein [Fictibacillus enclensis]MDM5335846.1 hypothetical protein [Fictibacillus enclensis]